MTRAAPRQAKTTPPTMATKRLGGGVLGEFANAPEVVVELPPAPSFANAPDRQRSQHLWWSRPRGHHLRRRTKTTQHPPFLAKPDHAPRSLTRATSAPRSLTREQPARPDRSPANEKSVQRSATAHRRLPEATARRIRPTSSLPPRSVTRPVRVVPHTLRDTARQCSACKIHQRAPGHT